MKRFAALLAIFGLLTIGLSQFVFAQDTTQRGTPQATTVGTEQSTTLQAQPEQTATWHQVLKEKFIEGGPGFMAFILLCLILGLSIALERVIYLNLSTTNTRKLLNKVETTLDTKGLDATKDICRNTRGPVASIFYQGLDKMNEGMEIVEKSIVSYGGVVAGRMERGLSWIALFIALAPMLGFLGTVIGMVEAFDNIEAAGDISPTIVAGGIKVALLTTVFGLIVAIILQIFYNYLLSKIDSLVSDMEDSTISFIDILTKFKFTKK
jgi:biopolymer transport protein ExbB